MEIEQVCVCVCVCVFTEIWLGGPFSATLTFQVSAKVNCSERINYIKHLFSDRVKQCSPPDVGLASVCQF